MDNYSSSDNISADVREAIHELRDCARREAEGLAIVPVNDLNTILSALETAQRDSKRMDWLGNLAEVRVETDDGDGPTCPEWHVRGSLTGQSGISRESLRAAIDAAMKQEGEQ